jgi:hypothetical protein
VNDVAAPLFRFFLADAQAAARAGDSARVQECIGLALDFVPESQRERVLLAAADLAPPPAWAAAVPGVAVAGPRDADIVVQVAPGAVNRPVARISWEHRAPSASPAGVYAPVPPPAPEQVAPRRRAGRRVVLVGLAVLAIGGGALVRWGPGPATAVVLGDPLSRAGGTLESGDPRGALALLDGLGDGAPASVWLVRGAAYEALADTGAAIRALGVAATRDAEGGAAALQAGDRLLGLGAVREAADAYLYAATPARTPSEVERIARAQERAGYPERARRVRQR